MLFVKVLIPGLLLWNGVTFFLMRADKEAAKKGKRRIAESSLFIAAFLLGALGIYTGMYFFRHKTKHLKFVILMPLLCLLNIYLIHEIYNLLL